MATAAKPARTTGAAKAPKAPALPKVPKASARSRGFFAGAFDEHGLDTAMLVSWTERASEIGAKRLAPAKASELLRALWANDRLMKRLTAPQLARLERYFVFATIPPGQDIVRQDEYGNFMLVLLTGNAKVQRQQANGESLQLAEARPGDILGEMSLLDSGARFSRCATIGPCDVAVLHAQALDEMLANDPALAASLIGLLARMLSLRLRAVSARLAAPRDDEGRPTH